MTDLHTLVETERAMQNRVAELGLDFEAAHAVSSIYRAANAVRGYVTTEVLRPVDISWTGFVVMWVVWIADGLETRQAAESAAISKATLTGVVKTLEARGWMEKVGREDDRRLVELHLTPSGKALMEDLYPKFNAIESRVVRGISPTRQKAMTKSLREIVTSIETSGVRPDPPNRTSAAQRLHERLEDTRLLGVRRRGVLRMPLHAEIPAVVVVESHRLDRPVLRRTPRRAALSPSRPRPWWW